MLNEKTLQDSLTTLSLNDKPLAAADAGIAAEYKGQALRGANWFFWIAALSMINSIVLLMNGQWNFLAGLGITQLIDGIAIVLAKDAGNTAAALALFLDIIVAGLFVLAGMLARKGMTVAFIAGMIIYALDGLIFLYVQAWISIAFHLYVLYSLYRGLSANNKFNKLQAETPNSF